MKKIAYLFAGLAIIAISTALAGCSDAGMAKFSALGTPARVTCYSGGTIILDDFSTGKVGQEHESDGIFFNSRTTGRLVETSADCVVDHMTSVPAGWQPVLP